MPLDLPRSGVRSYLYDRGSHLHNGIDLFAREGRPIYAASSGRVRWATDRWVQGFTGYGRVVALDADDGTHHLYAHLSRAVVAPGQRLEAGQLLGYAGRTGYSRDDHTSLISAAHLHFEVAPAPYPLARTAPRLDPVAYLEAGNVHPVSRARAGAPPAPPSPPAAPDTPPAPPSSPGSPPPMVARAPHPLAELAAMRARRVAPAALRPAGGAAWAWLFVLPLGLALAWSR